MSQLIEIAKLGKAVGLKGEMKCHLTTDFPEQFQSGRTFTLDKNRSLTIEYYLPDRDLIKFTTVHTREEAQLLTNQHLFTTMDQTLQECELKEGEHFWFEVLGCEVYEQNLLLGVVKEIQRLGAADYLDVATSPALIDRKMAKTFLVPYIDRYVLDTDIQARKIMTKDTYALLEES